MKTQIQNLKAFLQRDIVKERILMVIFLTGFFLTLASLKDHDSTKNFDVDAHKEKLEIIHNE